LITSWASGQNLSLNGNWTLICYSHITAGQEECKSEYVQQPLIALDFNDDGKTGTMTGHTSTNKVTGDYKIFDYNKIKVERFGGTKMGEIGWGGVFWQTISQSTSFEYKSDTLVIYYDNNSKAMKFARTRKE